MILLIDNYDSFAYNLYQLVGEMEPDIRVVRNDALTVEEIKIMNPSHIILSPGPGRPVDSGICMQVVKELYSKYPILGVCLGHQIICEALGGTVAYAKQLMHGKTSDIQIISGGIFAGLPETITVARYHSLAAREETLPSRLTITARAEDGEVMAVKLQGYHLYGLQFHPESILTPCGRSIIKNFLEVNKHD